MNYVILTMYAEGGVKKKVQAKSPNLDQLQQAVGGPIERLPYFTRIDTPIGEYARGVAYCNEDGKMCSPPMPQNQYATLSWWRSAEQRLDIIVGDAVFIAKTDEEVSI